MTTEISNGTPPPTGLFRVYRNNYPYEVSRTGIVLVPNKRGRKANAQPLVLSFINGSMCLNSLGEAVDASTFDDYLSSALPNYRLPRKPKEVTVAYFHPMMGVYLLTDPSASDDE